MWIAILEMIFKIVLVIVIGLVAIVWIACRYGAVELKEEQKEVKKNKKKQVKEGK